jgi:transketolase
MYYCHIVGIEDQDNWHGKPLGSKSDEAISHIEAEIKSSEKLAPQSPESVVAPVDISNITLSEPPAYKLGESVATRMAYGVAIAKLGKSNDRVIALDGDTKNSTFSQKLS